MQHFRFILFGLLILFISCSPKLTHTLEKHDLIKIDSAVGIDSAMFSYIKPYHDSIEGVMADVIGRSDHALIAKKPEGELSNFVADIVIEAGKSFLKEKNITYSEIISVINIKGLRSALPQGEITTRNIFEIMPFENKLIAVKMNPENMIILFNHIAKSNGDGISGASFSMINNEAHNILINNKPIDNNKTYWVITSDYLADGGDGYSVFKNSDLHLVSEMKVRELIIEHIKQLTKQNLKIIPDITPRITEIKNK